MANNILFPDIPVWEIILRSLTVFFFLLILIRLSGKRDVGEMSPADLILLLLLSANVHTSLSGDDKSLLGGLIGAGALMLVNNLLNRVAFKKKGFENVLKGHPEIIIHNGEANKKVMKKHLLSEMQLGIAIRKEGIEDINEVKYGVLETDGSISIIKKEDTAYLN